MITVVCGTNRPGAVTRQVTAAASIKLRELGALTNVVDLKDLPREIFSPTSYAEKPPAFRPMQEAILHAKGIVIVTPEYNGSFPGVLKYFIDMLKFPGSFQGAPVCFIGLAAGMWGGLRSVEQLAAILSYRKAHIYGERLLLPHVGELRIQGTRLGNDELQERFEKLLMGFLKWSGNLDAGA